MTATILRNKERLYTFGQLSRKVELIICRRLAPSTFYRWWRDGELEAVKVGRTLMSSEEAVLRYFSRGTNAAGADIHGEQPAVVPSRSVDDAAAAKRAAKAILRGNGVAVS